MSDAQPETLHVNDDSLVALGLVDPVTGQALPTDDWQPEGNASGPPASGGAASAGSATVDWESPENPYKRMAPNPVDQGRQYLIQKASEIDSRAQATYAQLVAQGHDANTAQALVALAREAAVRDARNEAEHLALAPVLARHVTEDIARRYSTGGIKIDPKELEPYAGHPERMEGVAQKLAEERRTTKAKARSASGTDRAEGGPPAGSTIDYSKLSPQQVIALGLKRGS